MCQNCNTWYFVHKLLGIRDFVGTFQSNEVYVKAPMTFDCNKPQRFPVTLFKFHLFDRKSLRFLAVNDLYLTIYET